MNSGQLSYARAGVDTTGAELALEGLLPSIRKTFDLRKGVGRPLLPMGYFANVLDLGRGMGLAISTDGVGTKALVAQMMDRYDTIGIDCVAMNVNDIICVGAEPIAMTDYIAVEATDPEFFAELGVGLLRGAERAQISIPGGELAQIKEMIKGSREGYGFDIVGTCVGVVATDRILIGQGLQPGDVVVGLASSGIHSNGLTLARAALFDRAGLSLTDHVDELGRSVGEELLEPTEIYAPFASALLQSDVPVKALINITSDGFLNLTRVESAVGFELDTLPEPQPIFDLIQRSGDVSDAEMHLVYNMGIGFCAIVPEEHAGATVEIAGSTGYKAQQIGRVVEDPDRSVNLPDRKLVGRDGRFHQV